MTSQKISCMVTQCKHNSQENSCELGAIKIAEIGNIRAEHETLCSNFEEEG